MESEPQTYCLRWNNHQSNLISVFEELRHNEDSTDLTFVVEGGKKIKCHKILLAASSNFIQQNCDIRGSSDQYIVVLSRETKYKNLIAIVEYIYRGEVNVAQDDLSDFLELAESLQVKGLDNLVKKSIIVNNNREEKTPALLEHLNSSASTSIDRTRNEQHGHVSPTSTQENLYASHGQSQSQFLSQGYWSTPAFPFAQHPALSSYHSQLFSAPSRPYDQMSSPLMKKKTMASSMASSIASSMVAKIDPMPILRTRLGQGNNGENETRPRSNGSVTENVRRYSTDFSQNEGASSPPTDIEDDERQNSPPNRSNSFSTSTAREWKRYKQYTREDINNAILEVQQGGLSALKAARKYKVPSRTLYDKVKKLGIKTHRHRRSSMTNGHLDSTSAQFPFGIGGNLNGSIYRSHYSLDDQNPLMLNIKERSPSPPVDSHRENEDCENMVEDLSVKSRKDNGVIVSSIIPKEEKMDTSKTNENSNS